MIRVGIGGWTYEPWRGVFYPEGLAQSRELGHASRHVTTIEINGTFYRTQTPATFAKWAEETPESFVFTLKAPRYATNRKVLAEAGESIERFVRSGIVELGPKLGPINWQFAPTKRFDVADFAAFVALLPKAVEGVALRHALEVRHASFRDPAFIDLARAAGIGVVIADADEYPCIADVTAPFVYARLQRAEEAVPTGYIAADLDCWAARARAWEAGGRATGLTLVGPAPAVAAGRAETTARDVFIFMINGAKVRAPAAAMALLERLGTPAAA